MKPFVAIDGVLDYLLFIFFRCISVEDCAKSEIACSAYGPVLGWNHDPVIAYMAGAARTMTAYLISCHFSEDGGADLIEPAELYLAGKNAIYQSKDAAMTFMRALNEE